MTDILQIVDENDESTVLWDFHDSTGANNPFSVKTFAGLGSAFALLTPATEYEFQSPEAAPGGRVVYQRDPLVASSFRMRAAASSYDNLASGINRLGQLLARGGVIKWLPDGSGEARFIDFEPSPRPALLSGHDGELFQALDKFDSPQGVPILITRQPYLRGPKLLSTVNKIEGNASMMVVDRDGDGRPDGWTWTNLGTGTITAESIDAAAEAAKATYTPGNGAGRIEESVAATAGEVWSGQIEFKVSGTSGSGFRLNLAFYDGAGGFISEFASGSFTKPTSFTRLVVENKTAPANTATVRLRLEGEVSPATVNTVWTRRAQLEKASAASPFRPGDYDLSNDPTTVGKGMLVPLFAQGEAPTPAKLEIIMGAGANTLAARYSARWNTGIVGHRSICDLLNRHHFRAVDATVKDVLARTSPADSEAIGGTGLDFHHRRQHKTNNGNSTSPSVTWDAATLAGNTLLMGIVVDVSDASTPTITPPGTWTEIQTADSGGNVRFRTYKIEGAAARSGAEAFTLSAARPWWAFVVELEDVGAVDRLIHELDTAGGTANFGTGTTAATQLEDEYLLAFYAQAGTPTIGSLTNGFTSFDDNVTNVSGTLAERIVTATGTFSSTATASPADTGVAGIITVRISKSVRVPRKLARWEITSKVDSLRGELAAYLRLKPLQTDEWSFQLRFIGSTGAAVFTGDEIVRSWKDVTTPNDYVLLPLGSVSVPRDLDLAGVAVEVWGHRVSTKDSTGDVKMTPFRLDSLIPVPTDDAAVIVSQTSDDEDFWFGSELTTPVSQPAGGSAGGVVGSRLKLTNLSSNAGAGPNAGSSFTDGLHLFEFRFQNDQAVPRTVVARVRNITDNVDAASATVTVPGFVKSEAGAVGLGSVGLLVDIDETKLYQAQVDDPEIADVLWVLSIRRRYTPTLVANERLVADPEAEDHGPLVYAADSAGRYLRDGETQGPTPDFIGPGLTAAFVTLLDPPVSGYADHEHVLARTATLRHSHSPRYPG